MSVYKNLMFMSVEMPNGGSIAAYRDFHRPLRQPQAKRKASTGAAKDRFRGVRIFDISDIRSPGR